MVSLPNKWVKYVGVKKGDELDIDIFGEDLVIRRNEKFFKKGKETIIDISGKLESFIRSVITNAYRLGFDKIRIIYKTQKEKELAKKVVINYLLGFEILKEEKNFIVAESISEPPMEKFDVILLKIIYNIEEQLRETINAIRSNNHDFNQELSYTMAYKYANFCRRILSLRHMGRGSPDLWVFITLLTHANRALFFGNEYLKNEKINVKHKKEFIELLEKEIEISEKIIKSYTKKDLEAVREVHEIGYEYSKRGYEWFKTFTKSEVILLHHYLSTLRNLYLSVSPVVNIVLLDERNDLFKRS